MNNTLRLSVVSISLTISACAGGGNERGYDPINGAQSEQAGSAMSSSAENSAKSFEGGVGLSGVAGACAFTVEPPQPDDADADGFPDELTTITVVNCMQTDTSGGATATYITNATFAVRDTALGSDTFAYEAAVVWSLDATFGNGAMGSIDYEGGQVASQPTTGSFQLDEGAQTTAHFENNGEVFDSLEQIQWASVYTPADGTWDYRAEVRPLENGNLAFHGGWRLLINDTHEARAAVSTPAPGLTVDVTCPTNIVDGVMIAAFDGPDGQAAVAVDWTGCGTSTNTYQHSAGGT